MTTSDIPNSYEALGQQIGAMTDRKNKAYGGSFDDAGAILQVLYPNGVQPEQYTDLLALVRLIDKLFRIASGKDGFEGESVYKDIAGYGLLGAMRRLRKEEERSRHAQEANGHIEPF